MAGEVVANAQSSTAVLATWFGSRICFIVTPFSIDIRMQHARASETSASASICSQCSPLFICRDLWLSLLVLYLSVCYSDGLFTGIHCSLHGIMRAAEEV